jgi:large subunit ribosomal protein L25
MTLTLRIEPRSKAGKGASRYVRRQKMVPGIVYGGGKENTLISLDPRDIVKGLDHKNFYINIFEFVVNGNKERAICKAVQFHPVTDAPIHVDFFRVSDDTPLKIKVPVVYENANNAPGVKQGGLLNIVRHSLEVGCTAKNIPSTIVVDLTGLEMGASIYLNSIELPDGVCATHAQRDNTLATISAPSAK